MKSVQLPIILKSVNASDSEFLFNLLQKRDLKVNISHKKMPTYNQHIKFLKSKPYSKWYIIILEKQKIGSIYLSKQNEIGIFLMKSWDIDDIRLKSLIILMKKNPRKRYLANVNPNNKKLISFWKKNNFSLVSYSYELDQN
jgi:hypothetical protein